MLGLIEGRIRFLDKLGDGAALIRHQGSHPEAATDPAGNQGFLVGNAQLLERHPHVFGGEKLAGKLKTPAQVLREWKKIKKAEKARARGKKA